jgi:hypothetical protein
MVLLLVHSNTTGMPYLKKAHIYYNCIVVLKEIKLKHVADHYTIKVKEV